MCKCLRIAELSRNILLQPLCGQATNKTKYNQTSNLHKIITYQWYDPMYHDSVFELVCFYAPA